MSHATDRLTAALSERYRIVRLLGQGGMASVYLAEDLKHERQVAIKVLKPELAAVLGAERFVQEIKTTAALSHPHILPLFDSGETDGFLYYVMPYIQGETIREKLNREGQCAVSESVRISTEIADALDYAHRHGVIHRDIKPENILLHDGRPMVMDFGIALAVSAAAGGRMTETGLSLGTPHYMSPEQATAERDITARSDIYSLASVLYEMLAGQPPHLGGTAQQIIMRIITDEARPVTELRKAVPAHVEAALACALEKLPADRFMSAKAFAEALTDSAATTQLRANSRQSAPHGAPTHNWLRDPRSVAALAVAAVGIGIAARLATRRPPEAPRQIVRTQVPGVSDSTAITPVAGFRGSTLARPAVSRDGRHLAFGVWSTIGSRLYLRSLETGTVREIPDGGSWPVFSADDRSVVFLRDSEVWRVAVADADAVPVRLGTIPERRWDIIDVAAHADGRILVTASNGVWEVTVADAMPRLLIPVDSSSGTFFSLVDALDDGRVVLSVNANNRVVNRLYSAAGAMQDTLPVNNAFVQVVDDVMLVVRDSVVEATRFDPRTLRPVGARIPIEVTTRARLARSIAWPNVETSIRMELVWVTRDGRASPLRLPPASYRWPRLSPDGGRLAVSPENRPTGRYLRVVDLGSGTEHPLVSTSEPTWMPDGRSLILPLDNRPFGGLRRLIADGSRRPDTLLALSDGDAWPTDVSHDGRWLAYYGATLGSGDSAAASDQNDLFFMDLDTQQSRRFALRGAQRGARFSPDGRWVAYESAAAGTSRIHVRNWPTLDANYPIPGIDATEPAWSRDGKELYFRQGDAIMAASVAIVDSSLRLGVPATLFRGMYPPDLSGDQSYDVAPDGRFLLPRATPLGAYDIEVWLNWIETVKARLDARNQQP